MAAQSFIFGSTLAGIKADFEEDDRSCSSCRSETSTHSGKTKKSSAFLLSFSDFNLISR